MDLMVSQSGSRGSSFWSCFTHQQRDPLSLSYGDELGQQYAYDSNVRNSRQIEVGDVLLIRDDHFVYGRGVVELIIPRPGVKRMRHCPTCGSVSKVTERSTVLPRFRCGRCESDFDEPRYERKEVTEFVAHYGSTWIEFAAHAPVPSLEPIFTSKDRQNAIRRLDPAAAVGFVELHLGLVAPLGIEYEPHEWERHGGHVEVRSKVRRFQDQFRNKLLDRYGENCAVTGQQPMEVLDAAHLYSYAETPVHRESGGLLLRKDVHRLFDAMLLTISADSMSSIVAPALVDAYPNLRSLEGRALVIPETHSPDADLLVQHEALARSRWKSLRSELVERAHIGSR